MGTLEQYDPESMANFVDGFYKNLPAESIPPPKSPFDDLVQLCVDYLKEYPLLVGSGLACPILLLLAFLWLMKGGGGEAEKIQERQKRKARGQWKCQGVEEQQGHTKNPKDSQKLRKEGGAQGQRKCEGEERGEQGEEEQ